MKLTLTQFDPPPMNWLRLSVSFTKTKNGYQTASSQSFRVCPFQAEYAGSIPATRSIKHFAKQNACDLQTPRKLRAAGGFSSENHRKPSPVWKLPDFKSCPKPCEFPYWKPATFFDVELIVFQGVRNGFEVWWVAWFGDGNGKVRGNLGMSGVRTKRQLCIGLYFSWAI